MPTLEPEDFIVGFAGALGPGPADVIDVACGRGRHALYLAGRGHRVLGLDRNAEQIRWLAEEARRRRVSIEASLADVESMSLVGGCADAIVNTLFLYRPLFASYVDALRPGGLLLFRTFTTDNIDVLGNEKPGRRFLLDPGELCGSFPQLSILHYEETVCAGRAVATLVGRKGTEDAGRRPPAQQRVPTP